MKKVLAMVFVSGLAACDNSDDVRSELDSAKNKFDTLVNKVENSAVVDSIRSKGGVILDSVRSKGGKLVDKAENEFNDLKKDSTN